MGKLVFWLVVAFVGYLLMKGLKAPRRPSGNTTPRRGAAAERMVACEHCGVNLPESESVRAGGRYYCSEEHRRLAS